jgi:filamentous hemagglutinin
LFTRKAATTAPAVAKTATTAMEAVLATDRNGLSWIGRALQKHSIRPGSAFKVTGKTHAEFKQAGEKLAKEILESPAAQITPNARGGLNVRLPDGRGISFNRDGTPHNLLEP